MKQTVPTLLANQAQNFFVASWRKQGWEDRGIERWPARQDKGRKSQGRAILVKSGKLRRAVGQSIRIKTFDKIQFVVALPYAAVHNDGYNGPRRAHRRDIFTRGSTRKFIGLRRKEGNRKKPTTPVYRKTGQSMVSAHNMKMPRRRFMGDSYALRTQQIALIDKEISKVWRG